jgi:acid phosphatase (class A)
MKTRLLFILAALAAVSARAADPAYVPAAQLHAELTLPAPPAVDAERTRAELAELHRIEAERTPAQVARAQADEKDETMFVFRDVLGDGFTAERLPRTAALSARVRVQEDEISGPLKSAFQRVRPYNQDKTLHPVCKTKTKADSYPSGHALAGWLAALTLVDLAPERREAILARADAYARSRLVCGVHFASDIEASKLLAYTVHAAMQGDPAYRQDVAAARAELHEALQNIPANSRAAP